MDPPLDLPAEAAQLPELRKSHPHRQNGTCGLSSRPRPFIRTLNRSARPPSHLHVPYAGQHTTRAGTLQTTSRLAYGKPVPFRV
eukprot:366520-Chlamydomonas_euryale.AAC.25